MSIVPSLFGGRRSSVFDPFSLDVWDPFKEFPITSWSDVSRETSALITGERNVEKEDKNDTWHRVERSIGKFTRRFRLPENAKMDQVKAAMENGVLTITVPKEEVKKPDVKSIQIS
ncbi:hypothetical protein M8C21_025189, partial [Ambrosia artemisiifolia]